MSYRNENYILFRVVVNEDRDYEDLLHNRTILGEIQIEVYDRDKGKCVKCGSKESLHFDHILPFQKEILLKLLQIFSCYVQSIIYKREQSLFENGVKKKRYALFPTSFQVIVLSNKINGYEKNEYK